MDFARQGVGRPAAFPPPLNQPPLSRSKGSLSGALPPFGTRQRPTTDALPIHVGETQKGSEGHVCIIALAFKRAEDEHESNLRIDAIPGPRASNAR